MSGYELKVVAVDYDPPQFGDVVRREKHIDEKGRVIHEILFFDPPLNGETVKSDLVEHGDWYEILEYDKNDKNILRTYFYRHDKADR